jgi:isochorismate synthase
MFEINLYQQLSKLQQTCLKQNIPFASFRLPLESEIISLVQHHSAPEKLKSLNDIDKKTGFVIAPFHETEQLGTYFLEPDCVYFSNEIEDIYLKKLSENKKFKTLQRNINHEIKSTCPAEFIGNVNSAVKAMFSGKYHKVVLSKIRVEKLKKNFSAPDFFLKLCSKYPHAFVYIVQLPNVGCWMGATPEPLLVIENEQVKTVSLAGTQITTGADIDSYHWSPKEIEEQGIVTNFIENLLHSLEIENIVKVGPENYQAANLIHLKTAFEFPVTELRNRFSEFLKALHPTPSVGGLPKNAARNFILENEKHDREYYTGFLGPVNINNKSAVFVNLRCLQLLDNQFVLYSGAGITSSSIAQKEWEETDNKMMTMMNVMNS